MLKDLIEKHAPINSTEKVDALISDMQNSRISHTNEVELQVLYEIRKSKLQIYFKEQWQKMGPTKRVSKTTSTPPSIVPKVANKPVQPAPFQGKKHKKKMKKTHLIQSSEPLPIHAMGDEIKSRAVVVSANNKGYFDRQARFERNRDKRVQPGYSSTGVKLPTAQAMKELQEKRQHYREVYYTNKRHKDVDDPKRGNGYIYIDTPM